MNRIKHGGNLTELAREAGCSPEELLDFSVNLNPCGPPPGANGDYLRSFDLLGAYPEPHAESLHRFLAEATGIPEECIQSGNGSNELLMYLPALSGAKRALIVTPGYLEYEPACRRAGLKVEYFPLRSEDGFALSPEELEQSVRPGDLVIVGNPGNPTGTAVKAATLAALAEQRSDALFLIDEAFADFLPPEYRLSGICRDNLILLRSLTKFYALPGLRMGYVIAPARIIAALRAQLPCWQLSTPVGRMIRYCLSSAEEFAERSRRETALLREELVGMLEKIPQLVCYPSLANYLLLETPLPDPAGRLLKEEHIAVRRCADYPGLGEQFFRVAVRNREENLRLATALARLCDAKAPYIRRERRTPALMIQGTCSNAGKSVLAAAFCRILLEDGISVAPFKAQNMALNSFVTPEGGEIGRAQAVQAEACRLDPDVRMNPILLKPESDHGSQVIVRGRPVGSMRAKEFFRRKPEFWREVTACYDSLSREREAIVLEGAGSPGEINLKSTDIVNMRMAEYADARVLLTGDIDRGGVYASFIGTYATFEPWERKLLHGFVVNKFRGDPALLGNAHAEVERFTGKPVLGVIDFLPGPGLPEEDSVGFSFVEKEKPGTVIDIALIRLGHIANFTDYAPLEAEPDTRIRSVSSPEEFGTPDVVILPGSKSVADDFAMLEQSGLAGKIREAVRRGCQYVGICGGLQLAGEVLLDPDRVESPHPASPMFGFLPLVTTMKGEKILRHTTGTTADGTPVSGYEIHFGRTECNDPSIKVIRSSDGRPVGFERGNCFTTYLHGIFDDDRFRRKWLDEVRVQKGLSPLGGVTAHYGMEAALARLAAHVRERIDIPALYRAMGVR